jgi:hypothetical protein
MKTYNFKMVNADTDGVSFKKADQKPFTDEERVTLLAELNSQMDKMIHWEEDGMVKKLIVVKSKNYVVIDEKGKRKVKGSALKATTKEKALQNFISEVIDLMVKDRMDQIYSLYMKYAREIVDLKNITDWCSKKTVTKAVLTSDRTNETRVLDAIGETPVQEGDKVYVFFKTPEELCLRENFDGTYCRDTLLGKLYDSLCVFETVIQTDLFPNFSLKRNIEMLVGPQPKKPRTKNADLQLRVPEQEMQTRV